MTILQFSRLFYPHIGGVEKHVLNLSQELIKKGHSVIVVTEQYNENLPLTEKLGKITIYRIPIKPSKNKKFVIWQWLFKNRNLISKADVVHAHDVAFWFFPFKFLYPTKKFYITFHGYETIYPPRWQAIVVRKISEALANGSIAIGEFIKKWYGANPDIVMYGGIDTKQVPNPKPQIPNKKQTTKILFIGRIEQDNGVEVYAQVLDLLKKKKFKYDFEVIGDGSLHSFFEKYGMMHGFKDDVNTYIQKADIVFASSYLSILESMAYKKPIISVYTNNLKKDYLQNNPFSQWITISDNPSEISKVIIQKEFKHTELAYQWVTKQTWEKIAEEYIKLWKK